MILISRLVKIHSILTHVHILTRGCLSYWKWVCLPYTYSIFSAIEVGDVSTRWRTCHLFEGLFEVWNACGG